MALEPGGRGRTPTRGRRYHHTLTVLALALPFALGAGAAHIATQPLVHLEGALNAQHQ